VLLNSVGVDLVAGAETDTRDARLATPVVTVGREVPLSRRLVARPQRLHGLLPGADEWLILFKGPRRQVLVIDEDLPGGAWFIVDQTVDCEVLSCFVGDERLDGGDDRLRRLAKGDAAVDENATLVGHGVVAGRHARDARDGDAALTQEVVSRQRCVRIA